MADNIPVTPGSGAIIAADEIGGALYQRIKIGVGADGAATDWEGVVTGPLTDDELRAADVPVTLGGETVTVDGTMTLEAGTAAIGKLAANSGVDIGDVDVLSLPPLAASSEVIGQVKRADAGKTMIRRSVDIAASQTAATVWQPTGSTKFVLTKLWYSASAAGAVKFFDHTDTADVAIGPAGNYGANGGFICVWELDNPLRGAAVDNILKYTSGAGATGSVYYEGWEEA